MSAYKEEYSTGGISKLSTLGVISDAEQAC